jgi:hypothetical protein
MSPVPAEGNPPPGDVGWAPAAPTHACFVDSGFSIGGFGVAVDLGVLVGFGVFVGFGVRVGAGVLVELGVLVGPGVCVAVEAEVGVGCGVFVGADPTTTSPLSAVDVRLSPGPGPQRAALCMATEAVPVPLAWKRMVARVPLPPGGEAG